MGGGVTQMAMPLVLGVIVALGATDVIGWRIAMVVPGIALFLMGIAYFRFTQDSPSQQIAEERAKEPPGARTRAFLEAAKDYRVWALFLIYGACFGVELTMHNIAALYYHDRFGLGVGLAGLIAGLFGLMNLFARTLGGIVGDKVGIRFGLRGRTLFLGGVLLLEGIALAVFSRMDILPAAIAAMLVFSLFVQMAEGATFSVVPFINQKALGAVAGIVGCGRQRRGSGRGVPVPHGVPQHRDGPALPGRHRDRGIVAGAGGALLARARKRGTPGNGTGAGTRHAGRSPGIRQARTDVPVQRGLGTTSSPLSLWERTMAGAQLTTATKSGNPVERIKDEKPGLDILDEIHELAAQHGGWETIEPGDRERLKWIGAFFRKPTPGRFMMRLRITNGRLTAPQLAALAELSRRLGSGVMDLTTRQQIELRDIQIRDVPEILDALRDIDLSSLQTGMDNIRGANTCALSGLTPNELFDAAPAGEEFTRMFLGNREYANLPRKLNVAFTGCLENCIHAETQDIAMTPATGPGGVALPGSTWRSAARWVPAV